MTDRSEQTQRIFSRVMARELVADEVNMVTGGARETGPEGTCWQCEPSNVGGGGDTKVLVHDR